MKAEINNENKAKFFALYWGQEIYRIEGRSTKLIATGSSFSEKDYIELKHLSQISDEDAIEVAKMATHLHDKHSWEVVKIKDGRVYFKDVWQVGEYGYSSFFVKVNSFPLQGPFQEKKGEIIEQLHYQFSLHAYDYLRSKGYALPWMGLSVDEMVKAGWIKLTEQ